MLMPAASAPAASPHGLGGDARRPGNARAIDEPRAEAVRRRRRRRPIAAARGRSTTAARQCGFDFKYGLTRGLILDATYRTDFAQVEEDLQQVNLTRFSLFFPEKRDFFLEGQGIFDFGGVQTGNSRRGAGVVLQPPDRPEQGPGGAGRRGRARDRQGRTLQHWRAQHSDRRQASARRVSTNFTALRVKRDFLRRSNIGVLATRRAPALGNQPGSSAASYTAGADATMLFFSSINFTSYYALTSNPGPGGDNVTGSSYRGRFEYNTDRYGASAEHMLIDAYFRPQVGYVRRTDIRRSFGQARFSPRPRGATWIRK